METLEVLGYLFTVLIGLSLGLIGSGGSILTIPVLVYLFQIDAISATSYSLVLVGATALIGAARKQRAGEVNWKVALIFGAPAIIAVYLTRKILMPAIPEAVALSGFVLERDFMILVFFALLMLSAAFSMLKKKPVPKETSEAKEGHRSPVLIVGEGLVTGIVTGLVGAGGGFLIIPALVILGKLPMKIAVGTSLAIISMKSLIGFLGDHNNPDIQIDFGFLLLLILLSSAGMMLGVWLSKRIDGAKLKRGFAFFVLLMAIFMLIREIG